MPCKIKLQITNYNSDTNKVEALTPREIGVVDETQSINLDQIAEFISQLSKEDRSTLAAQLRAAKVQKVTNKTVEEHQIVSNTSISDLITMYPDLNKYNLPVDLQYKCTLLKCRSAQFSGVSYKGRLENSKGEEIFIINNIYDAEKFFKHMSIRLSLDKFIRGNEVDDSLKEFEEDLKVIATRHHKNIQQLISNFLVNKKAYNTFKVGDKLYNPTRIINKILHQITGKVFDVGDKSDLQIELESIKESNSTNNTWILDKKRLYEVLSTFFDDFGKKYTLNQFKDLDIDNLNLILEQLFASDVKLIKARVKNSTKGEKVLKKPKKEKKLVSVLSEVIQNQYQTRILPTNPDLPKRYQDAAKKLGYKFKDLWGDGTIQVAGNDGAIYTAVLEMDEKFKVSAKYEIEVEPTVEEKPSYVTLNLNNWSSIGEIYDFSYAHKPLFTPTEYYKGFYIYEYHKDGHTHYAVSRSIISPNSYMKTFSDLMYAKQFIDSNKDTLKKCGLWTIKQHKGRPRKIELEMKGIREGQIITTLDLQLPSRFTEKSFSGYVNNLMSNDINYFHTQLNFIKNITTLDSPEKAVAFIYLTHDHLKRGQDYVQFLKDNDNIVQEVIKQITSSKTVSYLVEKEEKYRTGPKKYYLKYLNNDGTNVSIEGTLGDLTIQDFIDQNLDSAINYFNKTFGIGIKSITRSELELMSKKYNLGLENKLDVVRAFVYNGEIYINTSNANAQDLFHELSHIFLGVLKVKDFQAYQEIVNSFVKHKNYQYQYNKHRQTYQHYSEQDVVEEVVADMIAEEMFKAKQLGTSDFVGNEFLLQFEEILKRSERFTQTMNDNGLGFSKYMKDLLDENTGAMQRNMKISNKVKQLIADGIITEKCE